MDIQYLLRVLYYQTVSISIVVELESSAAAMVAGATESTASRCPIVVATAATSVARAGRSASHTTSVVTRTDILAHQCSLAASHPVFSL
jgi:hypothetical protein